MTRRVAIIGAAGHVGGTLVERLLDRGTYEVRPVIHTAGNAWRLARRGIRLWQADLSRREQIREAIVGCEIVVNCSFPPSTLMEPTVKNLTDECLAAGIQRFVHLSSIAVYGEFPSQAAEYESATERAKKPTYGYYKHRQDLVVERAARRGLPSVVLCPPNITGLNSRYAFEIIDALRRGTLPLVGNGDAACVLVDVVNLAAAIELAFDHGAGEGQRIFINDDEETTWRDVVDALLPLVPDAPLVASISEDEARRFVSRQREGYSVAQAARRIAGLAELKRIVKQTPTLLRWARRCRDWSKYGPKRMQRRSGSGSAESTSQSPPLSRLAGQQMRGVRHRCDLARSQLGYRPELTFADSMATFRRWYEAYCGFGGEEGRLLWQLHRQPDSHGGT
ncbi:MAG: NAD-dependent epimerase/dehydratase family protein [Pirellulales bacterium]